MTKEKEITIRMTEEEKREAKNLSRKQGFEGNISMLVRYLLRKFRV